MSRIQIFLKILTNTYRSLHCKFTILLNHTYLKVNILLTKFWKKAIGMYLKDFGLFPIQYIY